MGFWGFGVFWLKVKSCPFSFWTLDYVTERAIPCPIGGFSRLSGRLFILLRLL